MSTLKVNAQPTYRLRPVRLPGKSTPEKGKFRAIITHRETYDTERVIQEMLDRSGHHMSVSMVESIVKELLDTMISSYRLSPKKMKKPYKLHIVCREREGFSLNDIFGVE